jgi:para-nitrobenzyl esterase
MPTFPATPLLLCLLSVPSIFSSSTAPTVTLPSGPTLTGLASTPSVSSFLGIRYGSAERFERAALFDYGDADSVDATSLGSTCPQKLSVEKPLGMSGDEDCLFLNVFSPAETDEELAPVAVFVHGGTYVDGSGNDFPGTELVDFWQSDDSDVGRAVVISINYRLNVFGFMGAEELRLEDGSTGNLGIQDQRLAFEWVRNNVEAFGGDKDRVMIFGESAGAGSMTMHLSMKESFGLYDKVVLESGAFSEWTAQPLSDAQDVFAQVLEGTACATVQCLKGLNAEDLFAAGADLQLPVSPK